MSIPTRFMCFMSSVVNVATLSSCLPLFLEEEDEVPDDETVNQMIARSEEEFDHFMVRLILMYSKASHCMWFVFWMRAELGFRPAKCQQSEKIVRL